MTDIDRLQPIQGTVDRHEEAPGPDGIRHYVVIETPEPADLGIGQTVHIEGVTVR